MERSRQQMEDAMNAMLDKKAEKFSAFCFKKTGTGTDVPFSVRDSGHTCFYQCPASLPCKHKFHRNFIDAYVL